MFLINTISSLKQFHTLSMDIHSRYRTSQFSDVIPRFNERFILSLSKCNDCVIMDDEFNILPISSLVHSLSELKVESSEGH